VAYISVTFITPFYNPQSQSFFFFFFLLQSIAYSQGWRFIAVGMGGNTHVRGKLKIDENSIYFLGTFGNVRHKHPRKKKHPSNPFTTVVPLTSACSTCQREKV
jgi:hypothetical protein